MIQKKVDQAIWEKMEINRNPTVLIINPATHWELANELGGMSGRIEIKSGRIITYMGLKVIRSHDVDANEFLVV
jgi:hypothetical protein